MMRTWYTITRGRVTLMSRFSRLTEFARAGETSGMPFNGPKVLVPLRPGDVRMIATPRTEEGYGSIHT
jgi:hypothetical protein